MIERMARIGWPLVVAGLCLLIAGCRNYGYPSHAYGRIQGAESKNSLNGLTVFREMVSKRGHRTYKLERLAASTKSLDAILWTPTECDVPSTGTTIWFEEWLAAKSNRTLFVMGRDFTAAPRYWQQAAEQVDGAAQHEFLIQKGMIEAKHDRLRHPSLDGRACHWFAYRYRDRWASPKPGGLWSDLANSEDFTWPIRDHWAPLTNAEQEERTAEHASGQDSGTDEDDFVLPQVDELSQDSIPSPLEYESLLTDAEGENLVFRIRRKEWGSSQIIVLPNAAPILNFNLVRDGDDGIAQRLISEITDRAKVGFLLSSIEPRLISPDEVTQSLKGFEMLTVWPLSLMTMHAVILGLIVLLALFPIFGRARSAKPRSTRDFGHHLEALGHLLQKSRDRNYALRTLSHYFRFVKNEPTSIWCSLAESDSDHTTLPTSPPRTIIQENQP